MPYTLQPVIYTPNVGDPVAWQVAQLRSRQFESADAIVVLPCHDDARIWQEIVRLSGRRIKIVVMDFEPPQELFINQRLPIPAFVSSDFTAGGMQAGELLVSFLESNPTSYTLVLVGPSWSKPGAGRSSRVLFVLAQRGCLGRTHSFELTSWDPATVVPEIVATIGGLLSAPARELVVFTGDDRLLTELHRALAPAPDILNRVALVGYDGARGLDGQYLVRGAENCVGTIDTQPELQGAAAGKVLLEAYRDEITGFNRVLVSPRAVQKSELV